MQFFQETLSFKEILSRGGGVEYKLISFRFWELVMWFIAGLLGAAIGYFAGWFFNFWEFVNWILALFGFILGYAIGKEIQKRSEIADYILECECPMCSNCKVRGGIEN